MKLEKLTAKSSCGPQDYLVFCGDKRVRRLRRVDGTWVVMTLSCCSVEQCYAPDDARLLRASELPLLFRFALHKVPDEDLTEAIFGRYRLSGDWTQLQPRE